MNKRQTKREWAAQFALPVRKKIKTREDWCPTVGGVVEVSLLHLTTFEWRVCVWGGDDLGMERDFSADKKQEAQELYEKLTDNTTMYAMKKLGMKYA